MDEFYVARKDETPVVIVFPTASQLGDGEPYHCIQTRPHYFGTKLTPEAIVSKLKELGIVDRSTEPEDERTPSVSLETFQPINPRVHEYAYTETEQWGFCTTGNRKAVRLFLYFSGWDLYHMDCPNDCYNVGDPNTCEYQHAYGWDYEDKIIKDLQLNCE